jgi:hypothetical protein
VLPQERIARVRFFDEGNLLPQVEEISLYDLNSHPVLQHSLGDHVLIRSKLLPPTGVIEEVVNLAAGFVEGLVRTVTDYDDDVPTHQRAASGLTTEGVDWMGEVYKINTDGTVKVRLARPYDPLPEWTGECFAMEKGEELIVFEGSDDEDDEDMDSAVNSLWTDIGPGGHIVVASDNSDEEWEDASEGDMDVDIPETSLDGMDDVVSPEPLDANAHVDVPSSVDIGPADNEAHEWGINTDKCAGFAILETVPDDHTFKADRSESTHGRDWLARIRKEHKILLSSLPGMNFIPCLICRGHSCPNL